ncbi:hypothetical protein ACWC9Q_37900 [Streptomyces sp. NPDC001142]
MSAEEVLALLDRPPLRADKAHTRWQRRSGAHALLTWLASFPGESWQERWEASPAALGPEGWAREGHAWLGAVANVRWNSAQSGLLCLAVADVLRLPLAWQFRYRTSNLRPLVERTRDPEGFARLEEAVDPKRWASTGGGRSRLALARIMLTKGGGLSDITADDAFEYATELRKSGIDRAGSTLFYSWLRDLGNLPPDTPVTLRFLDRVTGQLSCEQLVDRHGVTCEPIRALLIDYLEERRPRLDYSTLDNLARALTRNSWSDLERHHPGIDSLALAPEVATAWKERLRTRVQRRKRPDGTVEETVVERADRAMLFIAVRAFYLDIARWAVEEPGRWGPWAAPCPIKEAETTDRKRAKRVKAQMDQRTRERLPALESFAKAAADHHHYRRACLESLLAVQPGKTFRIRDAMFVRTMNGDSAAARDAGGNALQPDSPPHQGQGHIPVQRPDADRAIRGGPGQLPAGAGRRRARGDRVGGLSLVPETGSRVHPHVRRDLRGPGPDHQAARPGRPAPANRRGHRLPWRQAFPDQQQLSGSGPGTRRRHGCRGGGRNHRPATVTCRPYPAPRLFRPVRAG